MGKENFDQSRVEHQKKWEREAKDYNKMPSILKPEGAQKLSAMDRAHREALKENQEYDDARTSLEQKKEQLLEFLSNKEAGSYWHAAGVKRRAGLSGQEIFASPEAQRVAKEALVDNLNKRHIDGAVSILLELEVPDEIINSPEVQVAAKEKIVRCLNQEDHGYKGSYWDAMETASRFNVPSDFFHSPEVQQAAKNAISNESNPEYTNRIKEFFGL